MEPRFSVAANGGVMTVVKEGFCDMAKKTPARASKRPARPAKAKAKPAGKKAVSSRPKPGAREQAGAPWWKPFLPSSV